MKTFLQFLDEQEQFIPSTPVEQEAVKQARVRENPLELPTSLKLPDLPDTKPTPAAYGSIRGMSDEEAAVAEIRGKQLEAQQRVGQTKQNLIAADPVAGEIAHGPGGQGGGLNDAFPLVAGTSLFKNLGNAGSVVQGVKNLTTPIETAVGNAIKPYVQSLGPASNLVTAGAKYAVKKGMSDLTKS